MHARGFPEMGIFVAGVTEVTSAQRRARQRPHRKTNARVAASARLR
jgi:hypothetical protein